MRQTKTGRFFHGMTREPHGSAAKLLKVWHLPWHSNGGDMMNWTALALLTNALIWAVMFADILHDLYKGVHNGKD